LKLATCRSQGRSRVKPRLILGTPQEHRLHFQDELSKSVAGKYISLTRGAGVDWALARTVPDAELEARLYRPAMPHCSSQPAPEYARIHQELKSETMTRQYVRQRPRRWPHDPTRTRRDDQPRAEPQHQHPPAGAWPPVSSLSPGSAVVAPACAVA